MANVKSIYGHPIVPENDHTHTNKDILDGITSDTISKINSIDELEDKISKVSNNTPLQCDGKIYGVKFPLYTVSGTPTGERTQAAVGLTAEPSTDTVAGTNDFDLIPLFRNTMVNGYLSSSGEFVETAVEGDLNFARDGSNGDVYSRFRLSYFRYVYEGDYEEMQVTDLYRPNEGWCPFGVFIKPDGTLRPYAYIAAYEMGYNADGFAASISGVPVAYNTYANMNNGITTAGLSHNTQRTEIPKRGAQYCGMTTREVAFLQFLFYVEFATKNSQAVMQGATSFNFQVYLTAAEADTNRVIIATTDAAKFPVGCTVSVSAAGQENIDRGQAGTHGVVNRKRVLSQEAYDDSNTALVLDVGDTTFTTDTTCRVSTMPWYTGATDGVLGTSGSPVSNSSGRYPMKYRGVENLYGNVWTIMSDVIVSDYIPYICYDNTKYQNAPNSDYTAAGYTLATSGGYVKEMGYDEAHPHLGLPTVVGGSTTTYYCDYYYISAGANHELLFGGSVGHGAYAGLSCWSASSAVSHASWSIAARLSVSGQRGAMPGG